ncbi:histidine phosphatase family protein [Gordonia insulae]|uniref:Phosphoserine phosphatase 2 n=1 Tax=Gordonia insulae TaxID=2420509 RepID=A0A3G8JP70_9ACTN|nr:histidine phosphatase family protein [Gordonia insulae]AZG46887.1 Putative phosphoserine phosphatase 2 [Gordonia insulae]
MARLHLVRHGETTSNVMRRLDTALPGAALTDFGVRQGVRFALEHPIAEPAILVSSQARRAQQTAELMGSVWGVEPAVADGIHEVQVGELEDRFDDDAHEVFKDVVDRWHRGELEARIPGGESLAMVYDRYLPVIDELSGRHLAGEDPRDVYVVSHGAAIRLIAARLAGVDPTFAASTHLRNTGSIELEYVDGLWRLLRWGAVTGPFGPRVDEPLVTDPMG